MFEHDNYSRIAFFFLRKYNVNGSFECFQFNFKIQQTNYDRNPYILTGGRGAQALGKFSRRPCLFESYDSERRIFRSKKIKIRRVVLRVLTCDSRRTLCKREILTKNFVQFSSVPRRAKRTDSNTGYCNASGTAPTSPRGRLAETSLGRR